MYVYLIFVAQCYRWKFVWQWKLPDLWYLIVRLLTLLSVRLLTLQCCLSCGYVFVSSITGALDLFDVDGKHNNYMYNNHNYVLEWYYMYFICNTNYGCVTVSFGCTVQQPWLLFVCVCTDIGRPNQIVRSVSPVWNNFIFFEVSPISFHQVTLTTDICIYMYLKIDSGIKFYQISLKSNI